MTMFYSALSLSGIDVRPSVMKISHRVWNAALPLAVLLMFLLGMRYLYASLHTVEFDADEGINVMKAMLLTNGYPLYSAIWSDQPPILTYILSAAFNLFGIRIDVARMTVLLFSGLLIGSAWSFLRDVGGRLFALAGVVLIILLPNYAVLSIAVMVGLPALALAMASLAALAAWHRRRSGLWLVISALALSLSVLTKLFTGFLAPVFVGGILLAEFGSVEPRTWRERLWPAAGWSIIFGAATLTLLVWLVGENLSQIVSTHLTAQGSMAYDSFWQKNELNNLRATWFLTAVGIMLALASKRWLVLYLVAWLGLGTLLLARHAPIWYHHEQLITIPAAMLAACAIGEVILWIRRVSHRQEFLSVRGGLFVAVLIGVLLVAVDQAPRTVDLFNRRAFSGKSEADLALIARMAAYAPETHWVITDRPMIAFQAGVMTPPHLAVFSRKRVTTGDLTEQEVVDSFREFRPEQVLITRFDWPAVSYIEEHYYTRSKEGLYVRNDLE